MIPADRWLFFRTPDEAQRWQQALDAAGLRARCVVWDSPFRDERGFWQPPRLHWRDISDPRTAEVVEIYWIDGWWFRNNVHIDFCEGGHHWAYAAIPENAIYIEPTYLEHSMDQRIVADEHESPERAEMAHVPGVFYEEAHGLATRQERLRRESYREVEAQDDDEKPNNGKSQSGGRMIALVEAVIAERRRR